MSPTARHGGNPGALSHMLDVSVTGSRAKSYTFIFLRDSAVLLVETLVSSISSTFLSFSGQTRLVLVTN